MKKQIILFLLCVSQLIARSQDIAKQNYGHLSLEDGLTQGYITAIVQDKTGYMWFGTNDGLNRYDGYNFRKFYNKLNDTTSLSSNQITSLSVDRNGILWIGTSNGLNYFDPVTDRFYHCKINSKVYKSQSINCVNVDKKGLVWFTYIDDPFLYKYNSESKKTETFKIPQNKDYAASKILNSKTWSEDITTWTFFESSDGLIWIGASSGELISFNKTNSIFKKYSPVNMNAIITSIIEVDKDRLVLGFSDGSFCFFDSGIGIRGQLYEINPAKAKNSSTAVYRMIADKNKNFYIGTQGEGLFFFDRNKKTLDQILFVDHSDRNIISKGAYSLYISKSGVLWTGTNGYGVYCLFPMSSAFKTINQGFRYTKENYHSNDLEIYASFGSREVYKSLRFQSVRGIYATDKFILVGGYVGLDKIDRIKGDIENISSEIVPYVFCPDLENPDNYLWIGTESTNFPLLRFDIKNKKLSGEPIDCKYIFSILPEKENILWLGTSSGLIKFNVKSKARTFFKNIPEDPKSLQPGAIRVIIRDNDGILWVGSETGGLSMLNENNGEFIRYQHNPSNIKSLSCNTVLFATVDKFNNIIIGTGGGGINVFDKHRETFTHITTQNGLPNNVVYAIMEDNNGIYWASTNNGICSINPKNLNIKCYYSSDGLQSNEFNTGSYFKDKNGFLYFGGVNGITYFDPDKIIENDFKPDVVLTYIKKNNEDIKFNKPMSEINEITFKHNDKAFTIGFSALSFYQSNKNTYAYKLTGYNDDWVLLGPTHELTFNSLEAGSYILQIVATNNDGLWSDKPLVLKIIIKPPIWETWWFILIVFITFSILVIGYVFFRINEAKKINKYLTQQVEERTKEINYQKLEIEIQKKNLENTNVELQKVNSTKDKFFSIIAHDLKSPFNAILGFSRLLNEEYSSLSDENRRAFAGNIKDASEATYRLLENLLEWSRMQANKIEFKPEVIDIGNIVLETFSLLHSSAEAKNIRLSSSVMFNTTAFADENMIKTVVRNLVSNAIKFTQTDGEVKISVSENNDYKEISISDNGVGISENDFKVLFHVDVSLKNRGTANESGTGLGLIICKEFIERNGGTITVKSTIGIGSTFLFTLPKSDKV